MTNFILENLVKRRRKGEEAKLHVNSLLGNISNNVTSHDLFTIFLVVTAIIIVLVL